MERIMANGALERYQKFERLLKKETEQGNVEITETEINTDIKFAL